MSVRNTDRWVTLGLLWWHTWNVYTYHFLVCQLGLIQFMEWPIYSSESLVSTLSALKTSIFQAFYKCIMDDQNSLYVRHSIKFYTLWYRFNRVNCLAWFRFYLRNRRFPVHGGRCHFHTIFAFVCFFITKILRTDCSQSSGYIESQTLKHPPTALSVECEMTPYPLKASIQHALWDEKQIVWNTLNRFSCLIKRGKNSFNTSWGNFLCPKIIMQTFWSVLREGF